MAKTPNLTALLIINFILHFISGSLAGVWLADLVSSSGGMTPLAWFETILAVIAISVGLSAASFVAMKFIPSLPENKRSGAKAAFIAAYGAVALVLTIAAASVLGSAAGERAHQEYWLGEMKTETEAHRRAAAVIQNRVPALTDCIDISTAMSEQEIETGAFSREGGDVGRVAVTLANIAASCTIARDAVFTNRAYLARQFARAERILIDMRRAIDSNMDRRTKMIAVRKSAEEWQREMRGINDALATEAMQAVSDSIRKDWRAAGLPASAANAITQNFDGLADALIEGLDDIAALKVRPLPNVPVVSNVAYLALYPDATMGALAVGAIIELIPLGTILIGMTLMERNLLHRAPTAPPMQLAPETMIRPKRTNKRRSVNGDARL